MIRKFRNIVYSFISKCFITEILIFAFENIVHVIFKLTYFSNSLKHFEICI